MGQKLLFNNPQNCAFNKGKIMEDLDNKYYTTLGKNLALRFNLNVIESEWNELGRYAWMVAHFVEAESIRDAREVKNK